MPDLNQHLRDVILLERDWLFGHAARLSLMARRADPDTARHLRACADQCRDRARILEDALQASAQDQPEAKAS